MADIVKLVFGSSYDGGGTKQFVAGAGDATKAALRTAGAARNLTAAMSAAGSAAGGAVGVMVMKELTSKLLDERTISYAVCLEVQMVQRVVYATRMRYGRFALGQPDAFGTGESRRLNRCADAWACPPSPTAAAAAIRRRVAPAFCRGRRSATRKRA